MTGSADALGSFDGGRERRQRTDRRSVTWRTFVQGSLNPRRRSVRRGAEVHDTLIDWHAPHLMFLAVLILIFSVVDAFLTITLIARGAEEANPLLAVVLERFPQAFAAVKMALTGAGVVVLVATSRAKLFRLIRISHIIHWCLLGYVVLIGYEAWLLRQAM